MRRNDMRGFSVTPTTAPILNGPIVVLLFAVAIVMVAIPLAQRIDRAVAGSWLSGEARIIDGDTIVVRGQRVRLAGIDAPEIDQRCLDASGTSYPCGIEASAALASLTNGHEVTCVQVDIDRYRRIVARCAVGDSDLGGVMVRAGHAVDYVRYDREGRYAAAELGARAAKRGIWQGGFVPPEAWRHDR